MKVLVITLLLLYNKTIFKFFSVSQ